MYFCTGVHLCNAQMDSARELIIKVGAYCNDTTSTNGRQQLIELNHTFQLPLIRPMANPSRRHPGSIYWELSPFLGIRFQMQDTAISALSGGQKARLAMLILRLQDPNFYLLDEPTNHLDIEGQEALESELVAHGAACLLVSHARSFLRNVGNRYWWIKGKRLEEVDSPEPFLMQEMSGEDGL